MTAASIVRVERVLLVTLQDEISSTEVGELLGVVGQSVAENQARGVLIDVSALSLVDSFVARLLASLVAMIGILGAHGIIAGMRPEVAIAMVELGAEMPDIAAAINVDVGLANLRQRIGPLR